MQYKINNLWRIIFVLLGIVVLVVRYYMVYILHYPINIEVVVTTLFVEAYCTATALQGVVYLPGRGKKEEWKRVM